MTAIIGYTKRTGGNSIGALLTDNLVDHCEAKVDKLLKIGNRFVVAIAGLEVVEWTLDWTIGYFEPFDGSALKLNSIEDLEKALNYLLPMAFKKWKDNSIFIISEKHYDMPSILVVFDVKENKMYFADIGKVWRIDENPEYKINFEPLPDGLYLFGTVAGNKKYIKHEYQEPDIKKVLNHLRFVCLAQHNLAPELIGTPGAYLISAQGDIDLCIFKSGFNTVEELIDNVVVRYKFEKSRKTEVFE